jgi:Leucine-rich repeat (LRR) protein
LGVRFQGKAVIFDANWKGDSNDLKLLKSLKSCQELYFLKAKISNKDVLELKSINWIENLALRHLNISDQALANIPEMKQLKQLSIVSCPQIKGSGIKTIARSKTITQLHLPHQFLDDLDIAPLEKMTQLEYLSLHSNEITTASIKHLRTLKKLKWLFLKEVDITPEDCRHIAGLNSLRELSLTFMTLDSRHLKILTPLPNLEILRIRDTTISDKDLYLISAFKSLTYLQLKGKKKNFTQVGVSWLTKNCPKVKLFPSKEINIELKSPIKKIK